jgi:hypothetical protein
MKTLFILILIIFPSLQAEENPVLPTIEFSQTPEYVKAVQAIDQKASKASFSGKPGLSPQYCTGFHCYHYSQSFCLRYGSQNCLNVELLPNKEHTTGHAVNFIHQEVKDSKGSVYIVFCAVEPQSGNVESSSCGFKKAEDFKLKDISEVVVSLYCANNSLETYCDGKVKKPEAVARVSNPEDFLNSSLYGHWWTNPGRSLGQLVYTCSSHNADVRNQVLDDPSTEEKTESTFQRLPDSLPNCLDFKCPITSDRRQGVHYVEGTHVCKSSSGEAVNKTVNTCFIVKCTKDKQINLAWNTLDRFVPSCKTSTAERQAYCRNWRGSVTDRVSSVEDYKELDKDGNILSISRFVDKYTIHYCHHGEEIPIAKRFAPFNCKSTDDTWDFENGSLSFFEPKFSTQESIKKQYACIDQSSATTNLGIADSTAGFSSVAELISP